jgi:hypothetical protein
MKMQPVSLVWHGGRLTFPVTASILIPLGVDREDERQRSAE